MLLLLDQVLLMKRLKAIVIEVGVFLAIILLF